MAQPFSRYELPLSAVPVEGTFRVPKNPVRGFEPLLQENLAWYCRLRWMAAGFLAALGAASFIPGFMEAFGIKSRLLWPLVLAVILLSVNTLFLIHIRGLIKTGERKGFRHNLWAQIVLDLLVLTAIVQLAGSVETYAAFLYLFHVVLSCIFLPRRESLRVALLSVGLYLGCLTLEYAGVLPASAFYAGGAARTALAFVPGFPLVHAGFAVFVLSVVWFLTSQLSSMLRDRERDLMETNEHLLNAQKERMRFMLQTTHELKAPFAAIQINTQLLLKGHCGPLSAETEEVVRRISDRSRRLAAMIHEMLQLANLRSQSDGAPPRKAVDLAETLRFSIEHLRQIAEERRITFEADLRPARTSGIEDHLKILFVNLIKNAIQYSRPGGVVRARCGGTENGPEASIGDDGIGIPAEKLPRIFEEYYRTNEAIEYNKDSTGLGLGMVRHIAETHRIRIAVESAHGSGTRFYLRFLREEIPTSS